ncbi:MAG: septation protein SepH, partial [Ornithinimicrobium sp.]|uniref:septation protein SepH n=1 Tax=Ornithinimicrobium sp. TaxID=1977084 RepID=UPI0026E0E5A2
MQQLQFTELDDSGALVFVGEDGARYAVPVDDRLRAALRPRRVQTGPDQSEAAVTPREIQSMIRAGQTAEDVAAATGWEVSRVQRFEGPIIAEREHVVGLAKAAHVRAHGRTDGSHTLDRRVRERLHGRGVAVSGVSWDAARGEQHGPWTVLVIFTAGGKERRAAWHYDLQARSLDALDDEARWLSEDEQALPGGLAGHPLLRQRSAEDETNDLMATMRERRQRRTRRPKRAAPPLTPQPGSGEGTDGQTPPPAGQMVDEVLPLEDLDFDHATMGDPPAAHPRGSAPESPDPVDLPVETFDGSVEVTAEDPELEVDALPEGIYARTRHDPQEVSFEEFFGMDEDEAQSDEDDDNFVDEHPDISEDSIATDKEPAAAGALVSDDAV